MPSLEEFNFMSDTVIDGICREIAIAARGIGVSMFLSPIGQCERAIHALEIVPLVPIQLTSHALLLLAQEAWRLTATVSVAITGIGERAIDARCYQSQRRRVWRDFDIE